MIDDNTLLAVLDGTYRHCPEDSRDGYLPCDGQGHPIPRALADQLVPVETGGRLWRDQEAALAYLAEGWTETTKKGLWGT